MNTTIPKKKTGLPSCFYGMCMFCTLMISGLGYAADTGGTLNTPMDVIIDTDMDADDVAAIIFLGQAMKQGLVNIKAVTVENDGSNLPGIGRSQAECVLDQIGLGDIPVGDSSASTKGVNQFPQTIRGVLGKNEPGSVGEVIETATGCPVATCDVVNDPSCTSRAPFPQPIGNSVSMIKDALDKATSPMTIIAFGPLTDIAKVLKNGSYKSKIKAIYIMGGVTGIGNNLPLGNLCCGVDPLFTNNTPNEAGVQEFNIWGDPVAAQTVFKELSGKIYLTELKASNWVPLSKSFREALSKNQETRATQMVYAIANHPANAPGGEADDGYNYLFWWDPLSGIAALFDNVVTFTPNVSISVVQPPKDYLTSGKHNPHEGMLVIGTTKDSGIVNHGTYVPSIDLNCNGMLDYKVSRKGEAAYKVGNPTKGDEVANTNDAFHTYFLNGLNEKLGTSPATFHTCPNN